MSITSLINFSFLYVKATRDQVDQGAVRGGAGGGTAGPEELPGPAGGSHHQGQHCPH